MGKRKYKPSKSTSSLPRGLPNPKKKRILPHSRSNITATSNPFENARPSSAKAPKFHVHNRPHSGRNNLSKGPQSALQRSIEARRTALKATLQESKKAGSFVDRRIGESRNGRMGRNGFMTEDERMLARLVRERSRRSKKASKYALEDNDIQSSNDINLTHQGKSIDESYVGEFNAEDVILSDDDEGTKYDKQVGQLDKVDTELHFGGGSFDNSKQQNLYGPAGGNGVETLQDRYISRKEEVDDFILRKKIEKAEKKKKNMEQVETFEELDKDFAEFASLLKFRDKEKDRKDLSLSKEKGTLSIEDIEMEEWDKEMKQYMFERRIKATDRTKTPEEIAREEHERLKELEMRRLARMDGDFKEDELSDISDVEEDTRKSGRKKKGQFKKLSKMHKVRNPDEIDSDEEENDQLVPTFTADGIVYLDKNGCVVKRASDGNTHEEYINSDIDETQDESSESSSDADISSKTLEVGMKVEGNFRAEDQFKGKATWYPGVIAKVIAGKESGDTTYAIDYDDGDHEYGVNPENIRLMKEVSAKVESQDSDMSEGNRLVVLQKKRQKAKEKARNEIPYVFEVPTTLEALHKIIGSYAETGPDACLIINRIHASNSIRLDKSNKEKMQNFYDVILRRFVGVGDALYKSGNGGSELQRYNQLNTLTQILYSMAQDSSSVAGTASRRVGFFQSSLVKRLRDCEIIGVESEFTTWPSAGTLLLSRAMGHIFPPTDSRHIVVTPILLFLGQTLAQCRVTSIDDLVRGIFCAGLMIEFTRESKRYPPEAMAFLASVLGLFSLEIEQACKQSTVPSFAMLYKNENLASLRDQIIDCFVDDSPNMEEMLFLSLEKEKIHSPITPVVILVTTLRLVEKASNYYFTAMNGSEPEIFDIISSALADIDPQNGKSQLPLFIAEIISATAKAVSTKNAMITEGRLPLQRRIKAKVTDLAIETYAPRMEDYTTYTMRKDKGKSRMQAERDKMRREYKREYKSVTRELRLDAAFIETERRKERQLKDTKAREKRQKNYSWLEQEQATLNQQVAQGGGLLKGGGIGAAKQKVKSGKMGIKRGGKF